MFVCMNVQLASVGILDINFDVIYIYMYFSVAPGASRPCRVFLYTVTAMTLLYILALLCGVWQSALSWLTFLYFLSYIKLLITLSKYAPQVSTFCFSHLNPKPCLLRMPCVRVLVQTLL